VKLPDFERQRYHKKVKRKEPNQREFASNFNFANKIFRPMHSWQDEKSQSTRYIDKAIEVSSVPFIIVVAAVCVRVI
jgi:hypothetical protein